MPRSARKTHQRRGSQLFARFQVELSANHIVGTVGEPAIRKSPYFTEVLARTGYARSTGIIPIRPRA
jgi:hypothetical protein